MQTVRGGYRVREASCVTASLKNPESGGISFREGSESTEMRLQSGGPDGIDPVDKVLAQGEKTLVQREKFYYMSFM